MPFLHSTHCYIKKCCSDCTNKLYTLTRDKQHWWHRLNKNFPEGTKEISEPLTGPNPPPSDTKSGWFFRSKSSICWTGVWLVERRHGSDRTWDKSRRQTVCVEEQQKETSSLTPQGYINTTMPHQPANTTVRLYYIISTGRKKKLYDFFYWSKSLLVNAKSYIMEMCRRADLIFLIEQHQPCGIAFFTFAVFDLLKTQKKQFVIFTEKPLW